MASSSNSIPSLLDCVVRQDPPAVSQPLNIGMVGTGNITRMHLAGYRWAGLEVAAAYDADRKKADERAGEFGIPAVAGSLDELLELPGIGICDIAFPGNARLDAVEIIAEAGKHILVQKPLADDFATAKRMVEICEAAGVVLAVNQNARFCPQYRTVKNLLSSGLLGEPYYAVHYLASNQDGMPHHAPWLTEAERYQILQFGIHHIDQICWWFGRTPRAVTVVNSRKPGQQFRGDMLATLCFDFGETSGATLLELNALNRARPYKVTFEVSATRGAVVGSVDGDIIVYHDDLGEGQSLHLKPEGCWFPNAFGEVMADLQNAVSGHRDPEVSGRANLATLAVVEACYRSIVEKRTITAAEFPQ